MKNNKDFKFSMPIKSQPPVNMMAKLNFSYKNSEDFFIYEKNNDSPIHLDFSEIMDKDLPSLMKKKPKAKLHAPKRKRSQRKWKSEGSPTRSGQKRSRSRSRNKDKNFFIN